MTSANEFSIANFVLQGQPRRQAAEQQTAESTLVLKEDDSDDPDSFARTLKPVVMEAIQDILDELETVYDNIAKSARDHIHSECVLFLIIYLSYSLSLNLMSTGSPPPSPPTQRNYLDDWKIEDSRGVSQISSSLS